MRQAAIFQLSVLDPQRYNWYKNGLSKRYTFTPFGLAVFSATGAALADK